MKKAESQRKIEKEDITSTDLPKVGVLSETVISGTMSGTISTKEPRRLFTHLAHRVARARLFFTVYFQ